MMKKLTILLLCSPALIFSQGLQLNISSSGYYLENESFRVLSPVLEQDDVNNGMVNRFMMSSFTGFLYKNKLSTVFFFCQEQIYYKEKATCFNLESSNLKKENSFIFEDYKKPLSHIFFQPLEYLVQKKELLISDPIDYVLK